MNATIHRLLTAAGHIVTVQRHHCRFGDTWQPVCIADTWRPVCIADEDNEYGCNYVGPFVSHARAQAIAEEHRRKSAGVWRPAK